MAELQHLMDRNRDWAKRVTTEKPEFFTNLAQQQSPEYLWIGCSDSRVPANQIIDLEPGEVFVHRNIANVVNHHDLNVLSVLQYAVEVLKVKHILIVGHYGCGGVKATLDGQRLGLADNWLRSVKEVYESHSGALDLLPEEQRFRRLCELNVIAQVMNTCQTTVIESAWARGQEVKIHGLVYDLADGLLRDLSVKIDGMERAAISCNQAIRALIE
ncbi:carbonate dehydratase [Ferrimonas lipolytica]|uniref:Carbonic anhydrase n=1 Tax=Ferrimonas lipolytica TaxID=2724191 RepID=A0A6H1UAP3_9GAMM|nr:carbonate dehydratase [Ferrimonas lipolytica]QIZ76121.1 carbonate dehydratase [Ferrimonas lipolytica]